MFSQDFPPKNPKKKPKKSGATKPDPLPLWLRSSALQAGERHVVRLSGLEVVPPELEAELFELGLFMLCVAQRCHGAALKANKVQLHSTPLSDFGF